MHIARSMYALFFNAYLGSSNYLPASTGFARLDGKPEQAVMKVVPSKQTNRLKRKKCFFRLKNPMHSLLSMAYFGKKLQSLLLPRSLCAVQCSFEFDFIRI